MMTEKSLPQPSSPQVRSRTLTPYVIGWSVLAAASLLYLGALATQPALVAGYLGADDTAASTDQPLTPASETAVKEVAGDVQTLRNTIDLFRSELIELRAQVSNQTETARDIAGRVASLEQNPAVQRVAKEQAAKDAAKEKALAEAKAKEDKKLAAAEKKKALETGSVASPAAGAITFGPATVTTTIAVPPGDAAAPAGNLVGVQIARGPSVDSLRLSWTLLNERHGDAIRTLEPRVTTDVSGPNQTFDLVVGPIANVDEARKLCHELAMKATPCQVARFTGDALR
jgi:hypothetical protein